MSAVQRLAENHDGWLHADDRIEIREHTDERRIELAQRETIDNVCKRRSDDTEKQGEARGLSPFSACRKMGTVP
jgi:hypothetical protein